MSGRVHMLPKTVISRYSNTYTKKSKRLGILILPLARLIVVIFIYSNILLSVSMINIANMRVVCGRGRSLGLFEVLTRNRQSALGRRSGTLRAQEKPNRLRTIPPRQRLPVTKRLAIRTRRVIRVVINVKIQKNVYHYSSTKRERNRLFSTRDVRYIASFFSLLSVRSKLESNNPIARHNFSALTHEHTHIEHLSKRTVFPSTSIQRSIIS